MAKLNFQFENNDLLSMRAVMCKDHANLVSFVARVCNLQIKLEMSDLWF